MPTLLRHLELIFTFAGLLVISLATAIAQAVDADPWEIAAITATLVGTVHGLLFWVVRHNRRAARRCALLEVEHMLRDIVRNQLAVIKLSTQLQHSDGSTETHAHLAQVEKSIEEISRALDDISEESLGRWRSRYGFPVPPSAR